MKALIFERSEARYAAAKVLGSFSEDAAMAVGPLRLGDIDPPELPNTDSWYRLRPRLSGICGSDLSTIACETSRYFEPIVSFPFVLGHEIVGDLSDGRRVVVDAVLGHAARGFDLPYPGAAPGDVGKLGYAMGGELESGIQTGNCASTGGGWSTELVVHDSQIHEVPEHFSDEAAVLVEPCASGVHAAMKAVEAESDALVAVLGCGTIGLCALASVRKMLGNAKVVVTAKYPHQRQLAEELGADLVVSPHELRRAVRRMSGCQMMGAVLSGGADVIIDAVGSAGSIADALAATRPRGRVVLTGMPGEVNVDLAPLWHKEIELVGAYTYGTEAPREKTASGKSSNKTSSNKTSNAETSRGGKPVCQHTFQLAFELIEELGLERLVSAKYRLRDYRQALRHAADAGERGAIKIVFDLQEEL